MLNNILEKLGFKKKKKPLYTKKQFTKYSIYKGDTYVYDSYTNQWLLWYLIADDVDDGSISEFDMIKSNPAAVMSDRAYNTEVQETTLDGCLPKEHDLTKEGALVNNIDVIKELEKFSNIETYSSSSSSSNGGSSSSDSYYSSSDSSSSSSYDSGSSSSFSSSDSGGSCF